MMTRTGYIVLQSLVGLVLFLGIAKCWSISCRPTTNRKCIMALMLLLLSLLLQAGAGVFFSVIPAPSLFRFTAWGPDHARVSEDAAKMYPRFEVLDLGRHAMAATAKPNEGPK